MKRDKSSKSSKAAIRHVSKQKAPANWAMNCEISKCGGIVDADSHTDAKIEQTNDVQLKQEKEK
jgi:hypothetical protein